MALKRLRPFGLMLHYERLSLIDHEHGLIVEEPPFAAPARSIGKAWVFGPDAAELPGRLHLFASAHFPLAAYFDWFIGRFYALRKLKLVLFSAEPTPPLSISLWEHLFGQLGLRDPVLLRSPLHPLAASLRSGLLIYLADGVAQVAVCRKGLPEEIGQAGYGYFLTRALRQHVVARHGLQIDVPTAEQAWLRLGGDERQLTIEGFDASGGSRRQLLIDDELRPAFADAFAPLIREIAHQHALHPNLDLQLHGPHAAWLSGPLSAVLGKPLVLPPDPERILMHSIQQYLRGMA